MNTSFAGFENATFFRCLEDVSARHPLCDGRNFVAYRGAQFELTNMLKYNLLFDMVRVEVIKIQSWNECSY